MEIAFLPGRLEISNAGAKQPLDPSSLSSRFRKTDVNSRSSGLGLSISKAIADRFGLKLGYEYTGRHVFRLEL